MKIIAIFAAITIAATPAATAGALKLDASSEAMQQVELQASDVDLFRLLVALSTVRSAWTGSHPLAARSGADQD